MNSSFTHQGNVLTETQRRREEPSRSASSGSLFVFDRNGKGRFQSNRPLPPNSMTLSGGNAEFAEEVERVDARVVAVAKGNRVGVVADRPHAGHSERLDLSVAEDREHQRRLRRRVAFLAAGGAGTVVAKLPQSVATAHAIAPGDRQMPFVLAFQFRWIRATAHFHSLPKLDASTASRPRRGRELRAINSTTLQSTTSSQPGPINRRRNEPGAPPAADQLRTGCYSERPRRGPSPGVLDRAPR